MPQRSHGMSKTRTYRIWQSMLQRCADPTRHNYARYGGRGIGVDGRWHSFTGFFEDMGVAPDGASLDRIDNDKGYCKENCRWATPKEQQNNMRSNRLVEWEGQMYTVSQLADRVGMSRRILTHRLWRGWSVEKAVTTPKLKPGWDGMRGIHG